MNKIIIPIQFELFGAKQATEQISEAPAPAVPVAQSPGHVAEGESAAVAASVQGHASVFDVMDLGGDIVRAGAFAKSIENSGQAVPLFWEHSHSPFGKGDSMPVGVTTVLEEDSHGLFFQGNIADTTKGRDVIALMDTVGMQSSIGFEIVTEINHNNNGESVRELLELKLMEISIVTWGMMPAATARLVKGQSALDIFAAGVDRLVAITGV